MENRVAHKTISDTRCGKKFCMQLVGTWNTRLLPAEDHLLRIHTLIYINIWKWQEYVEFNLNTYSWIFNSQSYEETNHMPVSLSMFWHLRQNNSFKVYIGKSQMNSAWPFPIFILQSSKSPRTLIKIQIWF